METNLTLRSGWTIVECEAKLEAKYCSTFASVAYDLYAAQVGRVAGQSNAVTAADVLMTHAMNSRVTLEDLDAIMKKRKELRWLLTSIPPDACLSEDLAEHTDAASALVDVLCSIDGIKLAKSMKILALKRPNFFPMLDSHIEDFYTASYPHSKAVVPPESTYAEWGDYAIAIMKAFRDDMMSNKSHINLLATSVAARILDAWGEDLKLGEVRVLDSLIWFDWDGYKNFNGCAGDKKWCDIDVAITSSENRRPKM